MRDHQTIIFIVQKSKTERFERNWRKNSLTYGGARIRITQDFSKSWKQEESVVKYLKYRKKKSFQPKIIGTQSNCLSKMKFFEGEIKTLSDEGEIKTV